MVRQVEADMAVEDDTSHVANIGKMVEDMELKMRNLLQEVYFGKAKDVVGDLRSTASTNSHIGTALLIGNRHPITQPDEQRPRNTKGNDQQHGSVKRGAAQRWQRVTVHTMNEISLCAKHTNH